MRTPSLHPVDEDLRRYVVDGIRKRGIDVREGAEPVAILGDGRVERVQIRLADCELLEIEADFVFVGTGETPNSSEAVQVLGVAAGSREEIVVDKSMRTSVPNVYAIGDLIGPPMEMFKARKCGVTEVAWVGLSEQEARDRFTDVIVIQMPPYVENLDTDRLPLPLAERIMLYGFTKPELSGFQKLVVDGGSRRVLGAHHVGYGAKDAFQYLDYLIHRPQGFTIDELGAMNELFLNPEHFVQLSRLRAGRYELLSL